MGMDTEDMVVTMEAIMARDLLMLMLMPVSMVGTEALEDIMDTEDMVVTMEATMAKDLLMLMPVSMVGTEDTEAMEDTEELDLAVVFMEKEMLMQLPKLMQRLMLEFCMEDMDLDMDMPFHLHTMV